MASEEAVPEERSLRTDDAFDRFVEYETKVATDSTFRATVGATGMYDSGQRVYI